MKKVPLVVVDWLDAAQHPGWHSGPEGLEGANVRSAGYLVGEGKETITLAQSVAEDGSVADVLVIPRKWVVRRRKA